MLKKIQSLSTKDHMDKVGLQFISHGFEVARLVTFSSPCYLPIRTNMHLFLPMYVDYYNSWLLTLQSLSTLVLVEVSSTWF